MQVRRSSLSDVALVLAGRYLLQVVQKAEKEEAEKQQQQP